MSDQDIQKELIELREQVAALSAQKEEATAAQTEGDGGQTQPPSQGRSKFEQQLDELYGLLDEQIRDIPTFTALGIFALGILMGRLLPR